MLAIPLARRCLLITAVALFAVAVVDLLLLDEVAAHLDAHRRAALFDEICALGSQAWMTGTGPELFAEFRDRASTLIVNETDGVSDVGRA